MHYVKKQAPVLLTRRFLLHLVQLFYDRLNSRATRRALVEQICGNALSLNVAVRMKEFCSAVPKSVSIRSILMAALEDYTQGSFTRDAAAHQCVQWFSDQRRWKPGCSKNDYNV